MDVERYITFTLSNINREHMKKKAILLSKKNGFSLIELLIVMTLVVIVLTMNTDTFGVIFRQSRQQTQAVGAQMDRIVGLEILRTDLEHSGYGLPWAFQNANTVVYSEADVSSSGSGYNDCSGTAPCNPPRGLVSGDNVGFNNSDRLVIKSPIVGTSEASQRWYVVGGGSGTWGSNDRVIAIQPRSVGGAGKELVVDGTNSFFTTYSGVAGFAPTGAVVYGVSPNKDLRMPFNRADYYIGGSQASGCADGTRVLYKATVNHEDGGMKEMPLIDCVADMQVIYRLDSGTPETDISGLNAQQIRERVKEVRVYILSHEGQSDRAFRYSQNIITLGEFGKEKMFNLPSTIGPGWENYRWKVTTLVVKPRNLSS